MMAKFKKKNILTEDLFNSAGNTNVNEQLLNETVENIDVAINITSEEITSNDENIVENNEIEEVTEEIKETTDKEEMIIRLVDESNKSKSKKIMNNKKLGFNDESFYFND